MRKWLISVLLIGLLCQRSLSTPRSEGALIDSMDEMSFSVPKEASQKGHIELVPGKIGSALKFSYEKECTGVFMTGRAAGKPEWDQAAGFSFWVKGDGSDHLGGIELIWNGDYATRYAYSFPIDSTDWKQIVVPWRDLIPELSKTTQVIDPRNGNAPSKLGPIAFGKWWYWKDYAAHSYAIDEIRLEPVIALDTKEYRPAGSPLTRVLAKLKAGKPITMVTMGDSLTDANHWTNKDVNWPLLFKANVKVKYGSEVTIINPAMGGTELRQNLVVLPRWGRKTPHPDLVTILFGFNDWSAGMQGDTFAKAQQDAIDRVRRATGGLADILILTSCPPLENGDRLADLASACRLAAKTKNAGLCDIYSAFSAVPQAEKARLYVEDKGHYSRLGQELAAKTVLHSLEQGGR